MGLDTATAACTTCLLTTDDRPFEVAAGSARLFEQPAHARELLPAVDQAMRNGDSEWDDIAAIAVGVGPGAFTGLRIGVATARGLACAREIPLIPVSSLEAIAFELLDARPSARIAIPVLDAKRGELFVAAYGRGSQRPKEIVARHSILPEQLGDLIGSLPAGSHFAAGDGAIKHQGLIAGLGVEVPPESSSLHLVRARAICRLARVSQGFAATEVEPDYVREPDIDPNVLAAIAARGAFPGAN